MTEDFENLAASAIVWTGADRKASKSAAEPGSGGVTGSEITCSSCRPRSSCRHWGKPIVCPGIDNTPSGWRGRLVRASGSLSERWMQLRDYASADDVPLLPLAVAS
jgi:hypothetical protein